MAEKAERVEAAGTMAERFASQLAYGIAGFIFSRCGVFGAYYPFGAAVVGAAPYGSVIAALTGAVLGYIFPADNGAEGLRYIAAVLLCAALRAVVHELLPNFGQGAMLCSGGAMLVTALLNIALGGSDLTGAVMLTAEALLCFGGGYFFSKAVAVFAKEKIVCLELSESVALIFTVCMSLAAIGGYTVGGVSPARIVSVVVVLLCAVYGGRGAGSVAGIAAGFTMGVMSGSGLPYLTGGFSLGGLLAGLMAPVSRFAAAAAFAACDLVVSLSGGIDASVVITCYEVGLGCILFALLPRKAGGGVRRLFKAAMTETMPANMQKSSAVIRLNAAAAAIDETADLMEETAVKLKRMSSRQLSRIYSDTRKAVCEACEEYGVCWGNRRRASEASMKKIGSVLRDYGKIEAAFLPQLFAHSCVKKDELCGELNRRYAGAATGERQRNDEVRSIIKGQFVNTSEIIRDIASGVETMEQEDARCERMIEDRLVNMGCGDVKVVCSVDKNNIMTVEISAVEGERPVLPMYLAREVSDICAREMGEPMISRGEGAVVAVMSEATELSARVGIAQHSLTDGVCGDKCDFFYDGRGRLIMMISDGMGSGGRAAVDGAMAAGIMSRLIKAGFGFDGAVKIVNSAMCFKSDDESLATMDITAIDLHSGRCEFYKAGAPKTVCRHAGRVGRIEDKSLPLGILSDTALSCSAASLGGGDIVVMLSDGALSVDDGWIHGELDRWQGTDPQELADHLLERAVRINASEPDDITVAVMMISSAA